MLCLLLHHANNTLQDIFFVPSARLTSKRPPRIWNIQHTRSRLGLDMCRDILFLHAFTGCDTTSRFFGIGKAKAIKKYKESQTFRKAASTFFDSSSTKKDIASAGETVVKYLYDAEKQLDQPLHIIRCQKFHAKVATSSTYVQCKHLPPTTAACTEHSLRVFLQVQEWKSNTQPLDPEKYGWAHVDDRYSPIYFSGIKPAPDQLLRIIRCSCKGDCSRGNCTCKANGMECTSACKECKGTTCLNSKPVNGNVNAEHDVDSDTEEDYF